MSAHSISRSDGGACLVAKQDLEAAFDFWLRQNGDIPTPTREYRFAPPRRWRFDFAWPDHKLAVEIEGITYDGGRHQRVEGFIADCHKYEVALMQGWRVYRVPGQWIAQGGRPIWREAVMDNLRGLLGIEAIEYVDGIRPIAPEHHPTVEATLRQIIEDGMVANA